MGKHYTLHNLQLSNLSWLGEPQIVKTFYDEWQLPIDKEYLHCDVYERINDVLEMKGKEGRLLFCDITWG